MFPKVAALFYLPTDSAGGFQLLHTWPTLDIVNLFSYSYPKGEKHIQRQSTFACLSKLAGFPGVSHR